MTNQPNPRHVEILAEEISKRLRYVFDKKYYINVLNSVRSVIEIEADIALSAMQRAVVEAELKNKEYAQGFKDERDQWVNNWNHLDKLYQAQQSELTTLRTELERVRGLLERASWLVGNPATNISSSTDLACESWQRDYQQTKGGSNG
jgi:hypothetical protein